MATEESTGAGGKFRRKPWRRSQATPYDRPPTALRPSQVFGGERDKNSWLSKLVDPASRLITAGAHRLFSSVFRKRLLPPHQHPPDEKTEIRDVQPEIATIVAPSRTKEPAARGGDDLKIVSDGGVVAELGDILKKKTFTRSEIDHLSELLLSRTVDTSVGVEKGRLEHEHSNEKVVHSRREIPTNLPAQGNGVVCVQSAAISTPDVRSKVFDDVVASSAELAKAYMGSRPARASPLVSGSQNEMPREDLSAPYNSFFKPKTPTMPFIPKPPNDIGASANGFLSPRFRGRSAIYSMARTPYSRPHPTNVYKVAETALDAHGASTTSHNATEIQQLSGSKREVLKRRSSVLESDIGSVGPIRRIRQKPNLLHHKTLSLPASGGSHAKHRSGALTNVTEVPSSIDWSSNHRSSSNNSMPSTSNGYVPSQSIETAQKIFQQLDKFTSKGKSPEKKVDPVGGSSSGKMTTDMQDGLAYKSMHSVDSLKVLQNIEGNGKENGLLDPNNEHDHSPKISSTVEKGSIKKLITSSVKDAAEVGSPNKSPYFATPPSNFDHQPKRRAFQMSAHEDYLELDDDVTTNGVASTLMIKNVESHELSKSSAANFNNLLQSAETSAGKLSTPESQPSTNLLGAEKDVSLSDGSGAAQNITGFSLPAVPITLAAVGMGTQAAVSSPPSTAEIDRVAGQSEKNNEVTAFTSNSAKMAPFSFSPASSATESAFAKDLKPVFPSSATESAATKDGADKTAKKSTVIFGNVSKKIEDTPSSVVSPATFGLQSNGATLSNGLLGTVSVSMGVSPSAQNSSSSNGLSSDPVSVSSPPVLSFSNGNAVSTSTVATSVGTMTTGAGSMFTFGSSSSSSHLSTSVTAPSVSFGSSLQFGSPTVPSTFATLATSATESAVTSETKSNETAFGNAFSAKPSGTASVGTNVSGFNASTFKTTSGETQTAAPVVASGPIFAFQASSSSIAASTSTQSFSSQSASSASSPLFGLNAPVNLNACVPIFGSAGTVTVPLNSGSVSATNASGSSSVTAPVSSSNNAPGIFGWPAAKPTIPGSLFGTSPQSTGFAFGSTASGTSTASNSGPIVFGATSSTSAATNSAPFVFGSGSSAASVFSVPSAAGSTLAPSTTPFPSQPAFSSSNSQPFAFGLTPAVSNNDQMSMEDSMAEDSVQVPTPAAPVFGAPNPAQSSGFVFGGAAPSTVSPFQFGNQQNPMGSQNTSSSGVEFNAGGAGSFSVGSSVDKSSRRIVKVKSRIRRK